MAKDDKDDKGIKGIPPEATFKGDDARKEILAKLQLIDDKTIAKADRDAIEKRFNELADAIPAGDLELTQRQVDAIVAGISAEHKKPESKNDKLDPLKDNVLSAATVGAVYFAQFGADKKADKEAATKAIGEKMAEGIADKGEQKKVTDAAAAITTKAVAAAKEVEKVKRTLSLDETKIAILHMFEDAGEKESKWAKLPDDAKAQFEEAFATFVSEIKADDVANIKVPEDKIPAIRDFVHKQALSIKDIKDSKLEKEKLATIPALAGVMGILQNGLDEKGRKEPVKAVEKAFYGDLKDKELEEAKTRFAEVEKGAKKTEAGKSSGFAKVASVAIGAGLIAWVVSLFKSKPVVDTQGQPVKDENGQPKTEGKPAWLKALGVIAATAGVIFAYKVTAQGKEMGTALGELNPVSWVSKIAPTVGAARVR